jgi:hypothetical protein
LEEEERPKYEVAVEEKVSGEGIVQVNSVLLRTMSYPRLKCEAGEARPADAAEAEEAVAVPIGSERGAAEAGEGLRARAPVRGPVLRRPFASRLSDLLSSAFSTLTDLSTTDTFSRYLTLSLSFSSVNELGLGTVIVLDLASLPPRVSSPLLHTLLTAPPPPSFGLVLLSRSKASMSCDGCGTGPVLIDFIRLSPEEQETR